MNFKEFRRIPSVLDIAKSDLGVRICLFTIVAISIVQMMEIIAVSFFVNKQIMLALFKYFKLIFFEHDHINTSRGLKGFIIEVKVIMKFDSEHKTADKNAMDVEPIERKALKINVPVHNYYCYDETFGGEAGEFVESSEVVFEGDVGN